MFAPAHHQATRFVVPVRRELAVRTIFNLLGPLTNPAGATRQLIGVSDPAFLETIAGALARLGVERALVVSGEDGLDEMTTGARTQVVEVNGEEISALHARARATSASSRRRASTPSRGGTPERERRDHARDPRRRGAAPPRDLAVINAGAAIYAARRAGLARGRRARRRGRRSTAAPRRAALGALRRAATERARAPSMSVLERILEPTRARRSSGASARCRSTSSSASSAAPRASDRPFSGGAGRARASRVIAEFKRRSPSAGRCATAPTSPRSSRAYERGGAPRCRCSPRGRTSAARSTTCARRARPARCRCCARTSSSTPTSCTRRAAAGADAVLLIVAALAPRELRRLHDEARALGLDVLVEVHDERELERALEVGAELIGINNRDLRDFSVDVERTSSCSRDVPAGMAVVSESGIDPRQQLEELERAGCRPCSSASR